MENKEEFLSLERFKERVGQAIDKAVEERIDSLTELVPTPREGRPYMILKLVNETLTVVLNDGIVYTKPNATEKDYLTVQNAKSAEEILSVIEDVVVATQVKEDRKEAVKLTEMADGFKLLEQLVDFTSDGSTLYLTGTKRSIPPLLINKFAQVVGAHKYTDFQELEYNLKEDDEYQGLKNFFMWCCLNPRAEVAASLYGFLEKNGMKITKQGFFVALRNVVVVKKDKTDTTLIDAISNGYNKVKAVWKKNPADFNLVKDDDDKYHVLNVTSCISKYHLIGNLKQLYLDMPTLDENRYTDNWTHSFDIRIGQVVSMPSEKCNWSTQDCATAGLHFAGHTAPYVLCGDTTVFTLHNPMKVVGIGSEKGRCWEYLPFMTTNVKEANAIMNSRSFDFLQIDEEYAIKELEDLATKAKEGFVVEASKYEFNIPSISSAEINSIVLSLGEMKDKITKRVSVID
jgi:hypothetical protein